MSDLDRERKKYMKNYYHESTNLLRHLIIPAVEELENVCFKNKFLCIIIAFFKFLRM